MLWTLSLFYLTLLLSGFGGAKGQDGLEFQVTKSMDTKEQVTTEVASSTKVNSPAVNKSIQNIISGIPPVNIKSTTSKSSEKKPDAPLFSIHDYIPGILPANINSTTSKSSEKKPDGEKNRTEKPNKTSEKPSTDKNRTEHPNKTSEKPNADKNRTEKPNKASEKPNADKNRTEKPNKASEKPNADKNRTEKPNKASEKPNTEKSRTEKPMKPSQKKPDDDDTPEETSETLSNGVNVTEGIRFSGFSVYNQDGSAVHSTQSVFSFRKPTYILIHGISDKNQTKYVEDYFRTLGSALIKSCNGNCQIVKFGWAALSKKLGASEADLIGAVAAGKALAKGINVLNTDPDTSAPITLIGHDLGNVVAASAAAHVKTKLNHITGLEQRKLPEKYARYYLRKDMAHLVQLLFLNRFSYDYGHRNFFYFSKLPIFTLDVHRSDSGLCFHCNSYKLLAESIIKHGETSPFTFCPDYVSYLRLMCSKLPLVPLFNAVPDWALPEGRYFSMKTSKPL